MNVTAINHKGCNKTLAAAGGKSLRRLRWRGHPTLCDASETLINRNVNKPTFPYLSMPYYSL